LTEELLRESLRQGAPLAREEFVRQHQDAVYTWFRSLPMGEEAATAAAISFFRKLLSSRPPAEPLSFWLYRSLLRFPAQADAGGSATVLDRLRRLRPELRTVLFLRDIARVDGPSTAQILEISEATVRSRLQRARDEWAT
jgi:Sigma-70, region 4